MECKYCDEYTGTCMNTSCPMFSDTCPVPDTEGICKHEERVEVLYKLTPKGCAIAALLDVGLIKTSSDPAAEAFWEDFAGLMERLGYVHEETQQEIDFDYESEDA